MPAMDRQRPGQLSLTATAHLCLPPRSCEHMAQPQAYWPPQIGTRFILPRTPLPSVFTAASFLTRRLDVVVGTFLLSSFSVPQFTVHQVSWQLRIRVQVIWPECQKL